MEDLTQIEREYSSEFFFNSFKLININDDPDILMNNSYLQVQTLESTCYDIFVTVNGWYGVGQHNQQKTQLFPTFEGIAKKISPKFSVRWSEKLIEKLSALSDTEEDEVSESG